MYRFKFSLFTPNIFQLSSASCDLSICILQSPQFLGLLGHSSFARIIAKLASMWLATRTPTWTSITRRSPACYQSSHTHTHSLDYPPERTPYYNWVGILLPLRTAYHYWLVHRATLQPKKPSDSTDAGEGEGRGAKKGGDKCPVGDRLSPSVVY